MNLNSQLDRRGALKALSAGGTGLAAMIVPGGLMRSAMTRADEHIQLTTESANQALPRLRITDVKPIPMTVGRYHLTVVKDRVVEIAVLSVDIKIPGWCALAGLSRLADTATSMNEGLVKAAVLGEVGFFIAQIVRP